jgi:hypothetical protein
MGLSVVYRLFFCLAPLLFLFTGGCASTGTPGERVTITPGGGGTPFSFVPNEADKGMKKLPAEIAKLQKKDPEEFILRLGEYIRNTGRNDFDRVKKAHDWTALHIRYDAASYWADAIPDQNYGDVLRTGLAVCAGYAGVLKKLCDVMGIPCKTVHGYGRGVGFSLLEQENPGESNHAWNIVDIEGGLYLIDCTWDSGYMKRRAAMQDYSTEFLFARGEDFIYTHYPEEPADQLLDPAWPADKFTESPYLKPGLLSELTGFVPELKKNNPIEGIFEFEFSQKRNAEVIFYLYKNARDLDPVKMSTRTVKVIDSGTLRVNARIVIPASGAYTVRCFVNGEWGADFMVTGSAGYVEKNPGKTENRGEEDYNMKAVQEWLNRDNPFKGR